MGYRGHFSEKLPDASPCPTKPKPAGSRRDPPLAKAETIGNHSNDTVITYLRWKKKSFCTDVIVAREEKSENI